MDGSPGNSPTATPTIARDRPLRMAVAAGVLWVVAYTAAAVVVAPGSTAMTLLGNVAYEVPFWAGAALAVLAARSATGRRRAFWWALAAGIALTEAGNLYWTFYELGLGQATPFPSPADALYLAAFPALLAASLLAFQRSQGLRVSRALLDGSVLAVALGYVGMVLLVLPQLDFAHAIDSAVSVAYPVGDVVVLTVLGTIAFAGSRRRRPPLPVVLFGLAMLANAVTDSGYTYFVGLHEYVSGEVLDVGWQIAAVLWCLAAVAELRGAEAAGRRRLVLRDPGLVPVLCGALVTTVAVAVDGVGGRLTIASAALLVYVVAAVVARLVLTSRQAERTVRELEHSLGAQEWLAATDQLTGLYNRRFFEEALRLETQRSLHGGRPLGLLVIDVDFFKAVNDRHGHPAGDVVLRDVAARLSDCARPVDVVARHGGEEFVVMLPDADPETVLELAERCRRAVGERSFRLSAGEVRVTASIGAATLPQDAQTAEELLRIADRALYDAKAAGRNRVHMGRDAGQTDLALVLGASSALSFLEGLMDKLDSAHGENHGRETSRLAGLVADRLGLDLEAHRRCVLGARFHDVGKVRVPDAVLNKPGPLDDAEWKLVRRHPIDGAEIVALLPELAELARVIRHHHERFDGTGYPDRLGGEEIPLESRVVAVCDAWSAMRTDRSYRPAMPVQAARAELRAGAYGQFDPAVVDAFLAVTASAAWLEHAA